MAKTSLYLFLYAAFAAVCFKHKPIKVSLISLKAHDLSNSWASFKLTHKRTYQNESVEKRRLKTRWLKANNFLRLT